MAIPGNDTLIEIPTDTNNNNIPPITEVMIILISAFHDTATYTAFFVIMISSSIGI